jgi:hypothetical protein
MNYKNKETTPQVGDIVGYYYVIQDSDLLFRAGEVVGLEDNGSIRIVTPSAYQGGWDVDFDYMMPTSVHLLHRADSSFRFLGVR